MISRPLDSPQWPNLASVIIESLECDRYFIRILLSNSPGLQTLFLINVDFIDRTEREAHQEIRTVVNNINIENNDRDKEVDDHDDYLDLHKNIYLQSSCLEQLQLNDAVGPPAIDDVPCQTLTLNHVYMNDRMLTGIKTHAWSLTSIELTPWQTDRIQNGEVMPDTHRLVHSLLRGLPRLLSFKLKYWTLKFTATWLQTPWACQDLEHLVLRPYCDDDESLGLTAMDSQIAFLTHVGGLRRLKTLDFHRAVGSRDFYPEAHVSYIKTHRPDMEFPF
ncbi:hypothetical protein BGZ83_006393 [Gryganskiella cystojenkinii]|nr:hypothetical protein BGZ83_006393 [Gryganskiella cystojenkinii]